jgi:predicted nucleic acid-binding protein
MESHDKRILVSDTSVLINFLKVDRMDLVRDVSFDILVTEHVTEEIDASFAVEHGRYLHALEAEWITAVSLSTPEELALYAKLTATQRIGLGECSAIAYAVTQRCGLAIDDRRATTQARRESDDLTIVRTQDLMVYMISEGLVTIDQADEIKRAWESDHHFKLGY